MSLCEIALILVSIRSIVPFSESKEMGSTFITPFCVNVCPFYRTISVVKSVVYLIKLSLCEIALILVSIRSIVHFSELKEIGSTFINPFCVNVCPFYRIYQCCKISCLIDQIVFLQNCVNFGFYSFYCSFW